MRKSSFHRSSKIILQQTLDTRGNKGSSVECRVSSEYFLSFYDSGMNRKRGEEWAWAKEVRKDEKGKSE